MILQQLTDPLVIILVIVAFIGLSASFVQSRQLKKAKRMIASLLPEEQSSKSVNLTESVSSLVKYIREKLKTAKNLRQDAETENKSIVYQHKKLRSVLEVFPEGIVILDQAGTAKFANQKLQSLIGVETSEVVGKQAHDWCTNQQVLSLLVRYEGNVTRLRRTETVEFTPEDQKEKTLAVTVSPISLPSKPEVTIGILILFRDVTAESMAKKSRDDFIAHVSHELKSPLNIIKMHSELMLDIGDDEQQRITSINVINDEIDRVSNMITDLLNITRFEVGNVSIDRKRIRFRDFLIDVFEKMQRAGDENNIKFNLNLPQTLSHLSIDKDLFRVALNNILSNAIKYNKPDGLVTMEAEENNDSIIIRISDTGIGILEEDQKKIFEKFYRSDDDDVTNRNGHGLGLSLANEIIGLHSGSLIVESEKGKGTVFTLEIGKTSTLLKEAV